ncbi:hypothetical protein E2C01_001659 [Portunus trituberculatus]|uniref:Uncharacterized protein n=1 Tax=Portunus trituberculatus TaxID=210409 RepID=A0A5B7CHR6_PORTR|nr:hypothetical protein [Portunus trituberculatus]
MTSSADSDYKLTNRSEGRLPKPFLRESGGSCDVMMQTVPVTSAGRPCLRFALVSPFLLRRYTAFPTYIQPPISLSPPKRHPSPILHAPFCAPMLRFNPFTAARRAGLGQEGPGREQAMGRGGLHGRLPRSYFRIHFITALLSRCWSTVFTHAVFNGEQKGKNSLDSVDDRRLAALCSSRVTHKGECCLVPPSLPRVALAPASPRLLLLRPRGSYSPVGSSSRVLSDHIAKTRVIPVTSDAIHCPEWLQHVG